MSKKEIIEKRILRLGLLPLIPAMLFGGNTADAKAQEETTDNSNNTIAMLNLLANVSNENLNWEPSEINNDLNDYLITDNGTNLIFTPTENKSTPDTAPRAELLDPPTPIGVITIADSGSNIRDNSSLNSTVLFKANSSQEFNVLEVITNGEFVNGSSTWYQIQLEDGRLAFVHSSTVSNFAENPTAQEEAEITPSGTETPESSSQSGDTGTPEAAPTPDATPGVEAVTAPDAPTNSDANTVVETPDAPNASGTEVAPTEVNLENIPAATLVANENGIVQQFNIDHIETRDGKNVAVDAEGNILCEIIPGLEMGNDCWINTASSNGEFPINLYMSAQLNSLEPLEEISRFLNEGMPPNTMASLGFHDINNTGLKSKYDINWLPTWRGISNDELHPIFNGETPITGAEQIEGTIKYLQELSGTQELNLPDGSIWNPTNGLNIIVKRTFSHREIADMSSGSFDITPEPKIYLNDNGELQIEIIPFRSYAAGVTVLLANAFSQISSIYGAQIGESDRIDEEIVATLFSPDGNGGWAIALDVGYGESIITEDDLISFDITN